MTYRKLFFLLLIVFSCATSKNVGGTKYTYDYFTGFFLVYRRSEPQASSDVIRRNNFLVYYIKGSYKLDDQSNFVDTILLDTNKFVRLSSFYNDGCCIDYDLVNIVRDSIEPKYYTFLELDTFSVFLDIYKSAPNRLIDEHKSFIALYKGKIRYLNFPFRCDQRFSNYKPEIFGKSVTYIYLPDKKNKLRYVESITLGR